MGFQGENTGDCKTARWRRITKPPLCHQPQTMSDDNVIAQIRGGDEQKLAAIYRAYRNDFIYWAVRHFSCDEDLAKDVFQVAITIFYENIMSGKLGELSSSVKTYLFAIGKNKLHESQVSRGRDLKIQQYEGRKIKDGFQLEPLESNASDESEILYQILEKALSQLSEPCRTVLEMYYYREMSIDQIASAMQYKGSDSTKTQKYKCLTRLKKIVAEQMKTT